MFVYNIYLKILCFNTKKFVYKNFYDGPRGSKHGKFKSKKQIFMDFKFLCFEAQIEANKDVHKRKNNSSQK